MSAIKKMFGAGDSRDDEILYKTEGTEGSGSTAVENVDREIQSERDTQPGAMGAAAAGAGAGGILSLTRFRSAGTTDQTTGASAVTYASEPTDANPPSVAENSGQGRDTAVASGAIASGAHDTGADSGATDGTTAVAGGMAATGAAAGTGAIVYASDRGVDTQDDISKATYTERSYPLSSESNADRDAGTAGPGAGTIGEPIDTTTGSSSSGLNDGTKAEAGAAVFGTTILGAGAYAAGSREGDQNPRGPGGAAIGPDTTRAGGLAGVGEEREKFYGRPQSSPPVSPPHSPSATQTSFGENDSSFGKDAAVAGGAVTAAGAAGAAGYAATQASNTGVDNTPKTTTTTTETTEDHEDPTGQKKQGFFSKVFDGPDKSKQVPIGDQGPDNEVGRLGEVSQDLSAGDQEKIVIQKADAEPDAPVLVVTDRPGGQ